MRRIVFDLLAASTGGQMTRAQAFLARFRQHDPDSAMCILQEYHALDSMVQQAGVDAINFDPLPGPRALNRVLWQNLWLPLVARQRRFDTYLSFSHYLPRTLPRNITTVIGIANLAPFSEAALQAETGWRGRARLRLLKKRILSSATRADHVIALSHTCRDVLIGEGIAPGKINVISNGVDEPGTPDENDQTAETLSVLRSQYHIPEDFLLYVSHFYPYKNFVRLVQAYAMLPAAQQERHSLVLVGAPHNRPYFDAVIAAIHASGAQSRILVVPGLEAKALSLLYRATSLFVYPSLVENSPNILLEAMVHGAPVLAGSHQPMPEFGGDAIAYFDAKSVPSMTAAMSALLANATARARLKVLAPPQARQHSWEEFTRAVVSLYLGYETQTVASKTRTP